MNEENLMFATEDILTASAEQAEEPLDVKKYLIFLTDGLKMGVDAEQVVEINNDAVITYLPMLPHYIKGIVNLRGAMVPILDIRLRLGKPSQEDDFLIIVLNLDGTQIGILVDSVDQMVDIPRNSILPMPAHANQQLVSGMCSMPETGGTVLILDCAQLLAHE